MSSLDVHAYSADAAELAFCFSVTIRKVPASNRQPALTVPEREGGGGDGMTGAEIWMEKMKVITKQTDIGNAIGSIADKHHLDADPDPVFHFDADPDPASQNDADLNPASQTDADPCGSGSVQQEFGAGDINEGKIKIRGIIYRKEK